MGPGAGEVRPRFARDREAGRRPRRHPGPAEGVMRGAPFGSARQASLAAANAAWATPRPVARPRSCRREARATPAGAYRAAPETSIMRSPHDRLQLTVRNVICQVTLSRRVSSKSKVEFFKWFRAIFPGSRLGEPARRRARARRGRVTGTRYRSIPLHPPRDATTRRRAARSGGAATQRRVARHALGRRTRSAPAFCLTT